MFTKTIGPGLFTAIPKYEEINYQSFTERLKLINHPLDRAPSLFLDNISRTIMNDPVIYGKELDNAIDQSTFDAVKVKNPQDNMIIARNLLMEENKAEIKLLETTLKNYITDFVSLLESIHHAEVKIIQATNEFNHAMNIEHDTANPHPDFSKDQHEQFRSQLTLHKMDLKAKLETYKDYVKKVIHLETERSADEREKEFDELTKHENELLGRLNMELIAEYPSSASLLSKLSLSKSMETKPSSIQFLMEKHPTSHKAPQLT